MGHIQVMSIDLGLCVVVSYVSILFLSSMKLMHATLRVEVSRREWTI